MQHCTNEAFDEKLKHNHDLKIGIMRNLEYIQLAPLYLPAFYATLRAGIQAFYLSIST